MHGWRWRGAAEEEVTVSRSWRTFVGPLQATVRTLEIGGLLLGSETKLAIIQLTFQKDHSGCREGQG